MQMMHSSSKHDYPWLRNTGLALGLFAAQAAIAGTSLFLSNTLTEGVELSWPATGTLMAGALDAALLPPAALLMFMHHHHHSPRLI